MRFGVGLFEAFAACLEFRCRREFRRERSSSWSAYGKLTGRCGTGICRRGPKSLAQHAREDRALPGAVVGRGFELAAVCGGKQHWEHRHAFVWERDAVDCGWGD